MLKVAFFATVTLLFLPAIKVALLVILKVLYFIPSIF